MFTRTIWPDTLDWDQGIWSNGDWLFNCFCIMECQRILFWHDVWCRDEAVKTTALFYFRRKKKKKSSRSCGLGLLGMVLEKAKITLLVCLGMCSIGNWCQWMPFSKDIWNYSLESRAQDHVKWQACKSWVSL